MKVTSRTLIGVLLITSLTTIPVVGFAKTYSGNKLLTSVVKTTGNLVWNVNTTFKKKVTVTKRLLAKGPVTLGNELTDLIKINGTISSALSAVEIDDDVHITGQLELDEPLLAADLPSSGIVTTLTEGDNIDITDNGSGSYTIAATDTDTDSDTNTTYTAGTGLLLTDTEFSSTLGTSIDSTELGTDAVVAAGLASSAIQSGDIESGDLPADGYASAYVNDDGDTLTGTFGVDGAVLTSNGVPRQLSGLKQVPKSNTITSVDTTGTVGSDASITIGVDGFPVISYYDTTNANLKVYKCTTITCSSGTATAVDSTGDVGQYTSITIGTDGFPVISYFDNTNDDLKVTKCGNASCSASNTTTTVNSTSSTGQYTSITIGTDGFPVVSYYDVTGADLEVAKCVDVSCSGAATITTVDESTANTGQYTSITIGTDGFPVVSYYDVTGADLEVAKCTTVSCSTSTVATVDSTNNIGKYTSIAIGVNGLPIISYFDTTNGDLKVAACADTGCSSAATITSVDTTGSVGTFGSLTIGDDGLPMISYADATNQDLKILKCGTSTCSISTSASVDTTGAVGLDTGITIGIDGLAVVTSHDNTNGDLKIYKAGNPFNVAYWTRR